jgi:hypothetical protein
LSERRGRFLCSMICRVPVIWHSAKFLIFFKKNCFAECSRSGTRQSLLFFKK